MTLAQAYQVALTSLSRGDLAMAETICQRILDVEPSAPQALHLMGGIKHAGGNNAAAAEFIRRAIALRPDAAEYHNSLGVVLSEHGCFAEACTAYRSALRLRFEYPEAHYNLGNVLAARSHYQEAVSEYRVALQQKPDFARCLSEFGAALSILEGPEGAVAACRRAAELDPNSAEVLNNLGNVLKELGKSEEAIAAYRRAAALRPDSAPTYSNLGNACKDLGLMDEAIAAHRRAVALRPDAPLVHSNLVFELQFHPDFRAEMLRAEAKRWQRQHGDPLRATQHPHRNSPEPERPLKVGYVSPNFACHVISHFLVPVIEAHDRSRVEVHLYSSVARPDRITERLRRSAMVWRDVRHIRDEELAAQIREDGVDILVDLTQHMAENRLPVFARKPAPVQVSWLGYPGTTGLEAIDYRFTDAIMEPVGAPWSQSVEMPVRLPGCWFCFDPLGEYPTPNALPAWEKGHVTFGSLNNFCKLNERVLKLWGQVLRTVPDSRLLLQCPAGERAEWLWRLLEEQGIGRERIQLVPRTATRAQFLEIFHRIDIALDPFPYNGGTSTCEALWMGIPVLTLRGEQTISRIGLSILSSIGIPEFVAESEAGFVRLAAEVAGDLPALGALRQTLRERMKSSPFMDSAQFCRHVEEAYRTMWRSWCATQTAQR